MEKDSGRIGVLFDLFVDNDNSVVACFRFVFVFFIFFQKSLREKKLDDGARVRALKLIGKRTHFIEVGFAEKLDLVNIAEKQKSVPGIAVDLHQQLAFAESLAALVVFAQNRRRLHKIVELVDNRLKKPERFGRVDGRVAFDDFHQIVQLAFVFRGLVCERFRVFHQTGSGFTVFVRIFFVKLHGERDQLLNLLFFLVQVFDKLFGFVELAVARRARDFGGFVGFADLIARFFVRDLLNEFSGACIVVDFCDFIGQRRISRRFFVFIQFRQIGENFLGRRALIPDFLLSLEAL
jgi:hypothetical protein